MLLCRGYGTPEFATLVTIYFSNLKSAFAKGFEFVDFLSELRGAPVGWIGTMHWPNMLVTQRLVWYIKQINCTVHQILHLHRARYNFMLHIFLCKCTMVDLKIGRFYIRANRPQITIYISTNLYNTIRTKMCCGFL